MVADQLAARGIKDPLVLEAMKRVPRHIFVPRELAELSYNDRALPLGPDQSISQPYIVASMLESLQLKGTEKVLEVGTGSGYQVALLAGLAADVYSIDISKELVDQARTRIEQLKLKNVTIECRDGFEGWAEQAPFEAIIVTAAPEQIPRELVKQLAVGGSMVLPLGDDQQVLVKITKTTEGLESEELFDVRFVPMKGGD